MRRFCCCILYTNYFNEANGKCISGYIYIYIYAKMLGWSLCKPAKSVCVWDGRGRQRDISLGERKLWKFGKHTQVMQIKQCALEKNWWLILYYKMRARRLHDGAADDADMVLVHFSMYRFCLKNISLKSISSVHSIRTTYCIGSLLLHSIKWHSLIPQTLEKIDSSKCSVSYPSCVCLCASEIHGIVQSVSRFNLYQMPVFFGLRTCCHHKYE